MQTITGVAKQAALGLLSMANPQDGPLPRFPQRRMAQIRSIPPRGIGCNGQLYRWGNSVTNANTAGLTALLHIGPFGLRAVDQLYLIRRI